MPIISNPSPFSPDPHGTILYRLNQTILQVMQLLLFLRGLETELREIYEQCKNVIPAASSAAKAQVGTDREAIMHLPSHRQEVSPISRPIAVQGSISHPVPIEKKMNQSKQKGKGVDSRMEGPSKPRRDPDSRSATVKSGSKNPIPSGSSSSRISGASRPLSRGVAKAGNSRNPVLRSQFRIAVAPTEVCGGVTPVLANRDTIKAIREQISFPRPPRPPTDPSPFPKDLNLLSYPPELKREGRDWFVLFNPSPKIKRVLDVTVVHTLQHELPVTCVKFSQDAKWVAIASWREVQIYDVKTGATTCNLDHEDRDIETLCFSPDGKYLAMVVSNKQIRVWNIVEKQIHHTFEGHEEDIRTSIHFSPNGQFIVSGSWDGTVCISDVHDRTFRVITLEDHYCHQVWSLAFSPDGRYVAVGNANTLLSIWEVTTGVLVQRLRGHRDVVRCVAFTPDGQRLISGSDDKTLYWDVSGLDIGSDASMVLTRTSSMSSSPCLMNLTGHKEHINSIGVSHDGNWVVSGSKDGNVIFWDTRTGVAQCMLSGHKVSRSVVNIDLSTMGNLLATVDSEFNQQVRIWSYKVS